MKISRVKELYGSLAFLSFTFISRFLGKVKSLNQISVKQYCEEFVTHFRTFHHKRTT